MWVKIIGTGFIIIQAILGVWEIASAIPTPSRYKVGKQVDTFKLINGTFHTTAAIATGYLLKKF